MSFLSSKFDEILSRRNGEEKKPEPPPWKPIQAPSDPETLLVMLLDMYWDGVYREVKHILWSLVELRKLELSKTERERAKDDRVVGYEAFIDQICEKPSSDGVIKTQQFQEGGPHQPLHPLRTRVPKNSKACREAVAKTLLQKQDQEREYSFHFRARSMLQAAGLLDIDKLVEYRRPDERYNFMRKGKVPQLNVKYFEENGIPNLTPARCNFCRDILRGVLFQCKRKQCLESLQLGPRDYFCEDCFHNEKHPQDHLVKRYKHCILDDTITLEVSRKLCRCTTVPRIDRNGDTAALYPIDPLLKHRQAANGYSKCRLFLLPGLVAKEKCRELKEVMESRKGKRVGPLKTSKRSKKPVNEAVYALMGGLDESLDNDVPWALRPFANKFPFGNTHISLMVGPLIIENGAAPPDKYQGVLITPRDPLNYFVTTDPDDALLDSISVGYVDKKNYTVDNREIFTRHPEPRKERRLKACMKQVVGGAFSGYSARILENEIVDDLIMSSQLSSGSTEFDMSKVHKNTKAITNKMKTLLGTRIIAVLARISDRLFDRTVPLEWDFFTNNCQYFSDAILRYEDFGGLFGNGYNSTGQPLYLMSFVVRIESYDKAPVLTQHDIPNGQTEEYLLSFRSGRHDDSDIVDTLQEYWHDWGAFGGPLYQHQDHFPWDCTEAYKDGTPTCNDCTLSRHVWAFPFDSWSIIQLALQKDRRWYPPTGDRTRLTREEWLENRFKLFAAQDALIRGAIAMATTHELQQSCEWFRMSDEPRYDRLKLGGIHRAQPYSHHFEAGRFNQSYIAPWAHFTYEHRVRKYESMRLARQRLTEVPPEEKATEEAELSGGSLIHLAEELSVPIAIAAISLEASHLANTAVVAAAVPDPAAAAELAEAVTALSETLAQVGDFFGNIS